MARGFTTLLTVLLLAGTPGFSQIIIPGVGYPGGGYPGGGYPGGGYPGRYPRGGYPPGGQQGSRPENNATTFTGMLRKIEEKDVIVESDDKTITTISTAGSTKYLSTSGGSAKIGDFQPGDHVRVSANQDSKGVYHAVNMKMVKEGTPDEHSAASLATDDTSRPLGLGSSGDSSSKSASNSSSDSNRPKLRRAASSSDDSGSSSSGSSSNDNDPDRPRLRRATSSSDNNTVASNSSSASSNSSSSSSSSSSDDSDRPRMRRASSADSDGSTPAQITPVSSPSSSSSSASSSSTSASAPDDSGPPRLRRAVPSGSSTPSTNSNPVVADARPSLHADDVNGVTRAPSLPQPGASADGIASTGARIPRTGTTGDPVIDQAREAAFSFSETLPNYIVKQYTTRYATVAARGGRTSWETLDNVTADVIEEDGTEKYKNILVNGKPPREDVEKTGSWSRGEFSSLLQDVLSPLTNADFHGKRPSTIVNRAAFRYDFSVEQPNSHWHVESDGQSYMPGYTGAIWIDKENYRVLRIELAAQNMPSRFPLDQVESAVDYDYVFIGEGKYLLPTHSEALSCERGTNQCSRNVIEFRNYKKFTADTSITFDNDNK